MKVTEKQISATIVCELYKRKLVADRNVREAIAIIEQQLKNITIEK